MKVVWVLWRLVRFVTALAVLAAATALFGRAIAEFVPPFAALVPVKSAIARLDPFLMDLVRRASLPWTHNMRAFGLAGVAIALLVIRGLFEDGVESLLNLVPQRAPVRKPAPAPVAEAVAAAPAAAAADPHGGPTAVMATPPPGAVQSVTGTAFLASQAATVMSRPMRIGRYEVIEELGRGAMGIVFKARDPRIGRIVAIKTISAGAGADFEHYRARFVVEAKSAGRLNHPGIVAVYDVLDDDQGRPCLVMEFIEGTPLDHIAKKDVALPLPRVLDLVAQTARALDYAHSHGIIHRDIKPANIMVTSAGKAKLSDFGIAKMEGSTMTIAGQILGTPAFMSPEQCSTGKVDNRSDIFSLGAVLYTLATGKKPFPGDTFTTVAYKVVNEPPVPIAQVNPDLPPEFQRIIDRCMAKNPDQRYPTASALADELDALRAKGAAVAA